MAISWIFKESEGLTRREIFAWWERRRIAFNVLVGLTGVVTWLPVLIAGAAAVKPGDDFEEPIAMILGPFLYAILANICYTSGGIFDVLFDRRRPRVALFRTGLYFFDPAHRRARPMGALRMDQYLITGHKLP